MSKDYDLDPAAPLGPASSLNRVHSRHYSKNPQSSVITDTSVKTYIILQTYKVKLEAGELF